MPDNDSQAMNRARVSFDQWCDAKRIELLQISFARLSANISPDASIRLPRSAKAQRAIDDISAPAAWPSFVTYHE